MVSIHAFVEEFGHRLTSKGETIQRPFVSVIITGRNSSLTIEECVRSVLRANYPSDRFEVIYVDSQSTDDTLEKMRVVASQHQNFRLIVERGLPGEGRNMGIRESVGEVVAFTDSDCAVDENWIKNIVSHLGKSDNNVVGVGGPSFTHSSDGKFAKYIGRLWETKFGSAGARNPAHYKGLRFVNHNPTSNSALRKSVFGEVGLFSETLPVTEDEELDTRIRRQSYQLLYADDVVVWHHRKRTPVSFAKQMYSYGFWRACSGKTRKVPLKFLHFVPSFLLAYLILLPLLSLTFGWHLAATPLLAYLAFGLISGLFLSARYEDPLLTLIVPIIGLLEHVAYSAGFVLGLVCIRK